jgi:hypothetical protein
MSHQWQSDEHYTNIRNLDAARKKLTRVDEEPTDDVTAEAIWLAATVITLSMLCTLTGAVVITRFAIQLIRTVTGT